MKEKIKNILKKNTVIFNIICTIHETVFLLKEKLLENYLVIFSHKERIRYREHKIKHGKAKRVIYTYLKNNEIY